MVECMFVSVGGPRALLQHAAKFRSHFKDARATLFSLVCASFQSCQGPTICPHHVCVRPIKERLIARDGKLVTIKVGGQMVRGTRVARRHGGNATRRRLRASARVCTCACVMPLCVRACALAYKG